MRIKVYLSTIFLICGCGNRVEIRSQSGLGTQPELSLQSQAASAPTLLSAFFGLQRRFMTGQIFPGCNLAPGFYDGMPIIASEEINQTTLSTSAIRVTMSNNQVAQPVCAVLAPAGEENEDHTILLIGRFSNVNTGVIPRSVSIVSNLQTESGASLLNASVTVTPLAQGPRIMISENVALSGAELGNQTGTLLAACPSGQTKQLVRLIWQGGVTRDGTNEITETQRLRYQVTVRNPATGASRVVVPFAIGDLNDGDNNQDLCLDTSDVAVSVFVPALTVADPRGDMNPDTSSSIIASSH